MDVGWIVFFLEEKLNGWQMAKLGIEPDWSWGILMYLGCGKTLEDLDFPEYIYIYHLRIQHSHGKSLFFMGVFVGKSSINGPSIAMATSNNQRVYIHIYIYIAANLRLQLRRSYFFRKSGIPSSRNGVFVRWEEREPA